MKLRGYFRKTTMLIITLCLLFTSMLPGFAEETGISKNEETEVFSRIHMHTRSYIQLKEVQMLPNTNGNLISFTIDLFNGESEELAFIYYWVNLRTKSGSQYSVDLIEEDQNINRISINTSRRITFYANVPHEVQLNDLIIEFIQYDFTQANYERVLGRIEIPEQYDPTTPFGQSKTLHVETTQLDSFVGNFQIRALGERKSVSVTHTLANKGARSVVLPDYQYYIRTEEGLLYGLNKSSAGSEITIQPKDTETIQLQATMPDVAQTDEWDLVVTVRSEAGAGSERPIASYELTEELTDDESVAAGEAITVHLNDTPVDTYIGDMIRYERNDRWHIELTFHFENNGNDMIELPQLQYIVRTTEGIRYPLTAASDGLQLSPRTSEKIKLSGSVPTSVEAEQWQLILEEKRDNSQYAFPLAVYDIPEAQDRETEGIPLGELYEFSNPDGQYAIELASLQRLPWGRDDILSAEVYVHNRDVRSLPVPEIKGLFELDGVQLSDEQVGEFMMDQILALRPNEKTRVILYGKIPYTYEFNEIKLVLEEERSQNSDNFTVALADFVSPGNQLTLPVIAEGDRMQIDTIGNRSSIGIRNIHTYSDSSSKMFYLELIVENLEKRQNTLPNLAGFLKTVDGSYFPVTIQETENMMITPSGEALLAVHVQIPYNVYTSNSKLILGEQIETGAGDHAFVAASEITMPEEVRKASNDMENISIYPYNISFSRFRVDLSSSSASLSFHYELQKSRKYQILPKGHKLVMELVDDGTPYEQTFEFESDLRIGNHTGQMTANINIGDVSAKLSQGTNFEVKIYDEYEGYRKLLATRRVVHVVRN